MTIDLNKTFNYPSITNPVHQVTLRPIIQPIRLQNEIDLRTVHPFRPYDSNPGPFGGVNSNPPDLLSIDRFNEKNKW